VGYLVISSLCALHNWTAQSCSQGYREKRRRRKVAEVARRIKEQDKCPPNQTKEEEIGNLPDKEFRIMIVILIQNLENKMKSQINSLETKIEKMQESFNEDLEEIKKSQYIMNNAINEIKNTLETTNSRITEAEDRIRELEDRMVEINESERIKAKRIKRNEDNLRDLQDNIKRYNIRIIGVPEEEDKKKDRTNSKNISRTFSSFVVSIVGSVHFWLVPWSYLYFSSSIGPFLCNW